MTAPDEERGSAAGDPPSLVTGGHIAGLDGVRAVALLAVFAYHADIPGLDGAFFGLSQFFTLSGFLIATGLLREHRRTGTISLGTFWSRRFRRLAPGATVALLGVVLFGATAATAEQVERLPREVLATVLYVVNWEFVTADRSYVGIFDQPSPVQHFWSLSVEEQFYLFIPLGLIGVLSVVRSRRVLAGMIGVAMVAAWVRMRLLFDGGAGFDRVYLGTDTRVPEILAGVLIAVLVLERPPFPAAVRRALAWVGAVLYVGTLWLFHTVPIHDPRVWRGGMALFTAGTGVILLAIVSGGGPLRVLSWRPLVSIGQHCYGIYLFHWPIFLWLTEERTGLDLWPLFALRLAVTIPLAYLSNRYIELPIRRGRSLGLPFGRRWLAVPVSGAVVVAAIAVVGWQRPAPPPKTFGSQELSAAPTVAGDPVLDVLVVTGPGRARSVADELAGVAGAAPDLDVTVAEPFACTALVASEWGTACRDWLPAWSTLVGDGDPDVVLLLDVELSSEELSRLRPGSDPRVLAGELMGTGRSILADRGAPILQATFVVSVADAVQRQKAPFHLAMRELRTVHDDLRLVPELIVEGPEDRAGIRAAVESLRESLTVNRRRAAGESGRVMVVGDSQSQSLAFGLVRRSAATDGPTVWNAGIGGCGIVWGGRSISIETTQVAPDNPACEGILDGWSRGVQEFRPDRVVVWTSARDIQPRQLPGWDGLAVVGDDRLDDLVLATYVRTVDELSATGAEILWVLPPCLRSRLQREEELVAGSPYRPESIDHLREVIIPALVQARPEVRLLDLGADLCPGGEFLEEVDGVGSLRPDGLHLTAESSRWIVEAHEDELLGTAP